MTKQAGSSASDILEKDKDVYYSSFHALGKILYAKREYIYIHVYTRVP